MKMSAWKNLLFFTGLLLLATAVFVSCSDDDDDDDIPPILVEDGLYIKGSVTPFDELTFEGMLSPGINEVGQEPRSGMYEMYITIQAGSAGFNIVEVSGATQTVYGPAGIENIDTGGEDEQPNVILQRGTLGTSGVFTVPSDGLYHIIVDKPTNTIVIVPVPYWAIIGGVTAAGWSDTQMPMVGSFNHESLKFEIKDLVLRGGDFKFRYGGGWKVNVAMNAEEVKANTNFGGEVQGSLPNLTTTLVPGGGNYIFSGDYEGVYDVSIEWSLEDGFSSSLVKTGDVEPLPFPDDLYMIGDGVGTWDWEETNLKMVPVHSKPHLFWKIVWMNAEGEFKFAPERAWAGDFGRAGDPDNGIYNIGGSNLPVPGTAGYYMVVVNLEDEKIAVVDPKVYLIGDALGSGDTANPDGLFTVDNENQVIKLTKALSAGDLRMYAWFDAVDGWFTDWWQSEFIVIDEELLFRGKGDDQERVNLSAGEYTIELNFRDYTGSID